MRWFQGGIAEAVAASKAQNAVFVVFVEGNDDESKITASSIDSSDVSTKLENGEFVAIKLDSGSESYRQFAQIYQLVPVPSVFFIGGNGVPLEVVAGGTGASELVARIDSILEKRGKVSSSPVSAQPPATPAVSVATAPSTSTQSPNVETTPTTSAATTDGSTVDATSASSLTKDDKLERAKQLLELKRQQKQEEEEEAERNRELERRRVGQDVQRMRRSQQDQEMKELREQRQREKSEEATARQRVLLQIAQDKAERAARLSQEKPSEPQKQQQPAEPTRTLVSDTTRIQFRLPDGTARTHQFSSTAQLSEVRTYAATALNLPFSDFAMSTTFPRRDFTASDHCLTVTDLQLVPTAVILILPAASTAVVSSPGYLSAASRMFWSLLAPVFSVYTYLRGLVFGGGNGGSSSSSSGSGSVINRPAPNRAPPPPTEEAQSVRRRQPPPDSTLVRRQGNVHRLTNRPDSSDDENNTWNGNSTQQM